MKTLFKIPDEKYGWIVTAAAMLLMAMAFGLLVSVSVFFGPLEAEFGWSRAAVSFAYSSAAFMSGLGGIFAGRLADRFPTRPILMVGVFSLGLAFLMLSLMQGLGLFYVGYAILVGGLGNACFLAPLMSNVGFWFRRNKGVAMGMVLAGQSLGAALLPYIIRHLIAGFGWRQTYLMMAFAVWGLLFPAAFLVREPPLRSDGRVSLPESPGHHAVEKKLPAWLSPRALTMMLCAAIVFCCICMSIPVVHLFPLGLETGLAPERAALVLSVMMTTSIIGRVGVGRVADLIGGVPALMLASGGQTVMIYLFIVAGGGFEAMLLVAVGFG
ncbi:MAG: MFS transporter, partial [Deltaproteobacteria bacterium]|nr:MFS transporter [Deltaproteobacteria bacterium]